jgi:hypothetical protein
MEDAAAREREGQAQLRGRRAVLLLAVFLAGAASLEAQATFPLGSASPGRLALCNSDQRNADQRNAEQLRDAKRLTFRQRACWYGSDLLSPGTAARAALSSGIGQWRNAPYMKSQDADDYTHRFAVYYIRRTARETGELVAGYLNHEDPRPHTSGEAVFGKRMRSALLSVLVVRGDEGDRPALAPVVGSLASGFAGAACYQEHTGARYALQGAGISYSGYFGRALYQEFRPDLRFLVRRILRKRPG